MSFEHIAAVTGANKGIGLAIVRQLALQYPASSLNSTGRESLLVYLAARDPNRAKEALSSLHSDPELKRARALKQDGGLTEIKIAQLDISSEESIQEFATLLRKEHGDKGVDAVINNAGAAFNGFDADVARRTLAINYYGTLNATRALLPLLKVDGGRLVNLGSMAGRLGPRYSSAVQDRFYDAAKKGDVGSVTALMEEFQKGVEANNWEKAGFPGAAYSVSKAGVIGMTMAIARQEEQAGNAKRLVNVCCPGYVVTDMTKGRGVKTPDQGAMTPVMLAIGNIKGVTGDMWQNEKHYDW